MGGRSNLCNKRGSTRRGRTTVSSRASAPRIPVCAAIPEGPRGRRVASWRRAIVNPGSRFVSVPPTRTLPPPPSHRSCYVPGQVRGPVPPGQPAIISSLFLCALPCVNTGQRIVVSVFYGFFFFLFFSFSRRENSFVYTCRVDKLVPDRTVRTIISSLSLWLLPPCVNTGQRVVSSILWIFFPFPVERMLLFICG